MSDKYRQQWETLGRKDPYWAVLADPKKMNGRWDSEEFFRTGFDEVNGLLSKVEALGGRLTFGVGLDYGCGVGRLSRALSHRFNRVLAVDISEAMLTEARAANKRYKNIQFLHKSGKDLDGVSDNSVDFIYSSIVMQHIPKKVQILLLNEFCRILRPGAILVFQVASRPNLKKLSGVARLFFGNRILNIIKRLCYGDGLVMEMHTISDRTVMKVVNKCGVSLMEAESNDSSGPGFVSYRYFFIKN